MARLSEWLRYRRYYRTLIIDAGRRREPLNRKARAGIKGQARQAAKAAGRHRRED